MSTHFYNPDQELEIAVGAVEEILENQAAAGRGRSKLICTRNRLLNGCQRGEALIELA